MSPANCAPNTAAGLAQRGHVAQPHNVHNIIGHCCPGKILGESPETGSIDFAVQRGSQMVCCHPRWTTRCSPAGHPEVLRENVKIQIKEGSSPHEEIIGELFSWLGRSLVRILELIMGRICPKDQRRSFKRVPH